MERIFGKSVVLERLDEFLVVHGWISESCGRAYVRILALTSFAFSHRPGCCGVDNKISHFIHAVEDVEGNGQDKNGHKQPGATDGSSRDEHQHAAGDLTPSQHQPYEVWHVSAGKAVGGAGHYKANCLDQNYYAQSPPQSGQGDFRTCRCHK